MTHWIVFFFFINYKLTIIIYVFFYFILRNRVWHGSSYYGINAVPPQSQYQHQSDRCIAADQLGARMVVQTKTAETQTLRHTEPFASASPTCVCYRAWLYYNTWTSVSLLCLPQTSTSFSYPVPWQPLSPLNGPPGLQRTTSLWKR